MRLFHHTNEFMCCQPGNKVDISPKEVQYNAGSKTFCKKVSRKSQLDVIMSPDQITLFRELLILQRRNSHGNGKGTKFFIRKDLKIIVHVSFHAGTSFNLQKAYSLVFLFISFIVQ